MNHFYEFIIDRFLIDGFLINRFLINRFLINRFLIEEFLSMEYFCQNVFQFYFLLTFNRQSHFYPNVVFDNKSNSVESNSSSGIKIPEFPVPIVVEVPAFRLSSHLSSKCLRSKDCVSSKTLVITR